MRYNKKGIEMSISFLVTIIIAITIFIFGIRFIYNLSGEATELEGLTTEQLDQRIGELLCESSERVCIGIDKRKITRGKFDVFGVKITNIKEGRNFEININPASPAGYSRNNDPISTSGIKMKYSGDNVFIKRNDEENIGIGVEVPADTLAGTYIFNVKVQPYDSLHKLYVEVP